MPVSNTIRAGSAYVEVTANTSKLQRNLISAQAQLQAFGRTCTSVGRDLLMLSGAMSLPLILAAKSFAGFDDSMRLVQAVTQATTADFNELTVTAQRLGRETSYTAQQVADAMVSLGRMGFSPQEIQAAIADVLNLARATGTDLSEAGDIAANSLRIFGLEADRMSEVADVMTVTANSSAQTLTDLFEALKMGGPQAAAAGESIQETCASLAVLANMGIKGSLAGTALRKSFSQFSKVKVQEQLRAVGVETLDANGNLRKMADIMRDIAKVMQTMPTAEKLAFAEEIFDIRGSLAGLTLTANTDELDAMLAKLRDVDGVAADTAAKMDAGLGGSFRLLMSAVEGAMNAIADAMNSTLQPFIQRVTAVINTFTQWIEQNKELVTTFALLIAGAAALGVALIAVGIAAKGVAAGIAVVQVVTKGLALTQGLCIAAATALKNSFALIAQAFISYRTVTIPAMVGTEQFCAALGLASTTANRARASIIMMSNAEAAAAVKSAIVAKWHAMVAALTALRNSTIAATIATKAHAVAEMALGVKTAIVQGWLAMTAALKGLTFASIASATALKAQAIAEGAMTAGRAIAASWHAMTVALSGLTMATVSATIATKAHTAAEAICAAGTAALNTVRKAGAAIMAVFTAATLKSTIAVSAAAVGNFLLAAAAKVAAVAMIALSAIMSFIATHPVMAALLALGAILAGVCIYIHRTATYTAKLSEEASKLREENDKLRKSDILRMKRLTQLSKKQALTNAEMAEARVLAQKLQAKYGDLGITIQEGSARLDAFATAASRLNALDLRIDDPTDQLKLNRLKELSVKVSLEADEESEAEQLLNDLSKKYGNLGVVIDQTTGKLTALSEAGSRLKSVELKIAEPDLPDFDRLQHLTFKAELNTEELAESQELISSLSAKYGNLGIIVDNSARKITHLNTVAANLHSLSVRVDGTADLERVTKLMQLAQLPKLDNTSFKEATELISGLQVKYGDLGVAIDDTQMRIVALTDVQRQFAEAMRIVESGNDPLKEKHLEMLKRLKALGEQERLTNAEQAEARRIVDELTAAYGALGLNINTIAGNLRMATDAQKKFNKAMREAAISELDSEIMEIEANMHELEAENSSYLSYFNTNLWSQITGKIDKNMKQMEVNLDKISAYRMKVIALRQRQRALRDQGKEEDVTGSADPNTSDEAVAERVRQEEAKQQQAADQAANAERRMREIEAQIARERRSELENEIHDILTLRDEYKKLAREQLKAEREKPEGERNYRKIMSLRNKIAQANSDAQRRINAARQKAADELKAEISGIQGRCTEQQGDIKRRRELEEQDRQLDKQFEEDPTKAIKRVKQLIKLYQQAAETAKQQFESELKSAQADGKIDDDERKRLDEASQAYSRAESLVDKYSARLREAQSGTKKAAEETKRSTNGSFYAAALEARSNRSLAERTAKASEAIVANTKRTNDLLKNQTGTKTQTFK